MQSETLIVSVVGWSDTGKSTFITRAIAAFGARGVRCAAVKRAHNAPDYAAPQEADGKDTARFFAAGADTAYVGKTESVVRLRGSLRLDTDGLAHLFPHADIVFVEGAPLPGAVILQTAGDATQAHDLKYPADDVDAVLTDHAGLTAELSATGARVFLPADLDAIIAYLEAHHGS